MVGMEAEERPVTTKVLLIEDNPGDARLLCEFLVTADGASFEVEQADHLSTALSCLAEGGIDIVLLDLGLPDSQSLHSLSKVRAQAPHIPVVVLTSRDEDELGREAVLHGAQDYLIKDTINGELLARSIRYAMERNEMLLRLAEIEEAHARKEARLRKVIESSADGIIIVDKSGIVRFINHAAEAMLDRQADTLLGKAFGFPIVGRTGTEIEIIRRDGEPTIAEMRAVDTDWEGEAADLISLHAITERKRAEEILARQTEELARSNVELDQFAYVVSHDLQEPLRAIGGYLRLLQKRNKGRLDADSEKYITRTVDAALRMQKLINDLLDYSRVHSRGTPFEPTDCNAILSRALVHLSDAIEESGAVVAADPLPVVHGDDTQLTQLFKNLISNAIRFCGAAPPRVHISAVRKEEAWVFSVRDNGIGIDPKYADRIFIIFKRLHGRRKYPGTGIGLAICKKIVERHRGRIWVESELGKGSTFYFTVPEQGGSPQ